MTWYRVDFSTGTGTAQNFLDVPRNHQYIFRITKVSGHGFEDSYTAFISGPYNMEVAILAWHDPEMDDVVIDGEYYYGVTPLEASYWNEATGGQVKISTNSPTWSYTVTDSPNAGGNSVVWLATSGYAQGTEHTSTAGGNIITYDITACPPGTERTAYFHVTAGRFSTIAKVIQYPWQFDKIYVTPTGTIDPAGESRWVTIEGVFDDTEVRATDLDSGQEIVGGTIPAGSGSGTVELAIPAWMSDARTVAFEYFDIRHNIWRVIRTEEQETDPSRSILVRIMGFTSGQQIDPLGETFALQIEGDWPAMEIRVVDHAGNPANTTAVHIAAGTGTDTSYQITIDPNASWSQRNLFFQWSIDGGSTWYAIAAGVQTGYYIENLTVDHTDGADINRYGQSFLITFDGYYPELSFRAAVDNMPISTVESVPGGTGPQSVTVTVPEKDTEGNRFVTIQYQRQPNTNWIYIVSGNQTSTYIVLAVSGRVVAQDNAKLNGNSGAETMTWAEAMGIPTTHNGNTGFFTTYGTGTDSNNLNYAATEPTGCPVYAEGPYGAGTWRIPTREEAQELQLTHGIPSWTRAEIYFGIYWGTARYGIGDRSKSETGTVRCVRDPD